MQITALLTATLATAAITAYGRDVNQTYVREMVSDLKNSGFTSFASAIEQVSKTAEGERFLAMMPWDAQYLGPPVCFVPTNEAFAAVPKSVSSDTALLLDTLSYHFLPGFPLTLLMGNGTTPIYKAPNHTCAETMLDSRRLSGNQDQVLTFSLRNDSDAGDQVVVFPYQNNGTVTGSLAERTKVANFAAIPITAVLSVPSPFLPLAESSFPTFVKTLDKFQLSQPISEGTGLTVFAPNEAAMLATNGLEDRLNSTQVQNVLLNHIINGTSVYVDSYSFRANHTSAAGEPFRFMTNVSGSFVISGNITARILSPDIPMENGVVHIIDRVLENTDSDPAAARAAADRALNPPGLVRGGAMLTAGISGAVIASATAIFGIFVAGSAIF